MEGHGRIESDPIKLELKLYESKLFFRVMLHATAGERRGKYA